MGDNASTGTLHRYSLGGASLITNQQLEVTQIPGGFIATGNGSHVTVTGGTAIVA